MAELNLNQIIEKLNGEFTGETRKLVFWYDDKADFAEDIDSVELANAKILKLESGNQFGTKYFLEREDTATNYLIYAPFPKPDVRENHLEDTMLYSKRFFANKDRTQRFYDLEIENFNEDNILIGWDICWVMMIAK